MNILIGDTGLVGTTLKENVKFDLTFNSKNIKTIKDYELINPVVYLSCLPATKWVVNNNIKDDVININEIINILSGIHFNRIILISTIDVYCDSPIYSHEDDFIIVKNLSYGTNRYYFELLVKNMLSTDDLKIFRLPALFNKNIKKNVIYDLINGNNVDQININSKYQWYNLDKLNNDIKNYLTIYPNDTIFNLFTEPIETKKIVELFPEYINKVINLPNRIEYNFLTKYDSTGYITSSDVVFDEIKKFIHETINK